MQVKDLNAFQKWLLSVGRMKIITVRDQDTTDPEAFIYMSRYFIWRSRQNNNKANLFLHKIYCSDSDRHLHDHPWNWATFIIWGNYKEVLCNSKSTPYFRPEYSRKFFPLSFHREPAQRYHRLVLIKPVWSIFWHGPLIQVWGFKIGNTKVPHEEYLQSRRLA